MAIGTQLGGGDLASRAVSCTLARSQDPAVQGVDALYRRLDGIVRAACRIRLSVPRPPPTAVYATGRVFKLLDEKDNARERRRKVFEYFNTAITRENK